MSDIDIKRLASDLDYWLSVAPDEDATHYCMQSEGFEYLNHGDVCDIARPGAAANHRQQMQEELTAARDEAERLRGRVAELTDALTVTRDNMIDWAGYVDKYFLDKHDLSGDIALANKALGFNHLRRPPEHPFILRKQAEAVERLASHYSIKSMGGNYIWKEAAIEEATRLRAQADSLENGE